MLRFQGSDVTRELRDLADAEDAYRSGRLDEATRRVEQLLGELARAGTTARDRPPGP